MRAPLVLLCGPAFSGKTTVAAALVARFGHTAVSLDEINARRGLHGGEGVPDEEWARTHELALEQVERLLRAPPARVVVDDTLCYRFLRDGFRDLAARVGRGTRLIVLAVPEAEIRRRIAANAAAPGRRGIDAAVLERHLASFEWPAAGEPHRVYCDAADLDAWAVEGWLPRG